MNYVYLLLLRQMVIILAVSMPHLSLFLVADISRFGAHSRRADFRIFFIVAGLVNPLSMISDTDISITMTAL